MISQEQLLTKKPDFQKPRFVQEDLGDQGFSVFHQENIFQNIIKGETLDKQLSQLKTKSHEFKQQMRSMADGEVDSKLDFGNSVLDSNDLKEIDAMLADGDLEAGFGIMRTKKIRVNSPGKTTKSSKGIGTQQKSVGFKTDAGSADNQRMPESPAGFEYDLKNLNVTFDPAMAEQKNTEILKSRAWQKVIDSKEGLFKVTKVYQSLQDL
jgi:hypothetical protein